MRIIPERVEKYKAYMHKNIDSLFDQTGDVTDKMPTSYILAIMLATEQVGEALDAGATPEQAAEEMKDMGLTGYMAGMAALMVSSYNPRGEEFRVWWNEKYGAKEAKGTVNPAIVTVKPKKGKLHA